MPAADAAPAETHRPGAIRLPPAAGRYAAEFIGAFALVFAGPGAAVIDAYTHGGVTPVGIGLTFGLIVGAMIYAIGHISGAHINPAVTLAFTVTRHFPRRDVPGYLTAQLSGAAAASLVTKGLYGDTAHLGATLPSHGAGQAAVLEFVLTFFLMFVIMAVATDVRAVGEAAAIAIGGYVALAATFAGPIAGASMNPARSFGPALVSNTWSSWWVFWIGPIFGALAGALAYQIVRGGEKR
ncbi:MAG: MIP/aquaporin family protein [Dehalococcoidia bacterium]